MIVIIILEYTFLALFAISLIGTVITGTFSLIHYMDKRMDKSRKQFQFLSWIFIILANGMALLETILKNIK